MTVEMKPMTTWKPHGSLAADEQLHFLHIPKTAGRSMRAVLEGHFAFDELCKGTELLDLFARSPSETDQWRLFCGHYGRYIHSLLRRRPTEVTILREPIARSVSHYNDLKTREGTWLHEYVNSHSFEEFLLDPVVSTELMNLQTRYLALDDIDRDFFGYSRRREEDLSALTAEFTGRALLDKAITYLDAMAFVGLQERFDESLVLLAATFGWTPPRVVPRYNAAKAPFDPSTLSARAMDRLREITALDQELYDHAAAQFDANMQALTPERIESAYTQAMAGRPRVAEVRFAFERAFEGKGWFIREPCADGIVRRWTGIETTSWIDLPLETGRPLRLRFKAGAQTKDVIEGVRVALNGVELVCRSWPVEVPAAETTKRAFDVVLPAEVLARQPEFARIEFRVPRTVRPAEEFPVHAAKFPDQKDMRRLGLYFEWLEIFPVRC